MPTKLATRHDYGRRIARAMAHLAANLDRTPPLEELAAVAAFSPCHFHRVYRAVAGETPAETQLRARMSRAALALLQTTQPIARIARRAGYGSAAAFTRAFTAAHGVPPGAYRARGGLGVAPHSLSPTQQQEIAMFHVTQRDEPALRLAAIRHVGAYEAIDGTFDRLLAWANVRGLDVPDARWLGIYHDDPETVVARALRSDAALTVPPTVQADGEVAILELPPQRVAVLRFRGPYAELPRAYTWFYGTWLPGSGEEPADAPPMEEYVNDPRSTPAPDLLTDILIPLRVRVAA